MNPLILQAWMGAFGGRRFLLVLGCGIVTTALVWFDKIDDATFATVILGTVGAYVAAGTWQKGQGLPDGPVPTVQPPVA